MMSGILIGPEDDQFAGSKQMIPDGKLSVVKRDGQPSVGGLVMPIGWTLPFPRLCNVNDGGRRDVGYIDWTTPLSDARLPSNNTASHSSKPTEGYHQDRGCLHNQSPDFKARRVVTAFLELYSKDGTYHKGV